MRTHIQATDLAAVRERAFADHFRYGPHEEWNQDAYFETCFHVDDIVIYKILDAADADECDTTYLGTVEVIYSERGWHALYGIRRDDGRPVLFAN